MGTQLVWVSNAGILENVDTHTLAGQIPMPLTDAACRGAKPDPTGKPRKMADGGGLLLFVSPSGGKLWRMRYRFDGKEKVLSFGAYPQVTLADARALRDKAKRALADGLDPGANSKAALTAPAGDSFEAVAREWIKAQSVTWSPAHTARILSRFERDAFPAIGSIPVAELTAPQILDMLRPVEDRAPDVAGRIRMTTGAIMRFAIATGRASRDPAADLRGALKPTPRVKHMARIEAGELAGFLWKLHHYDGEPQTRFAIEFVMHTFVRTNELRFGRWREIDGDVWRIPASRMKMNRDHIVPLTPQSLAILAKLKELAGDSEWIVPGRNGKPMSENTMLYALYRLGYHGRATIHGFRGLASTVLNESGLWSVDAIEKQLAHEPKDKVRRAYNAAQLLPERRRMLEWWSEYIDKALEDAEQRSLAEYVVRRKVVLDFIEILLEKVRDDSKDSAYQREDILHSFICPVRVNNVSEGKSRRVEPSASHDLWIVDERLTFAEYFSSDVEFNSLSEAFDSEERADVLIFDYVHGLRQTDEPSKVLLVEFKRPGRTRYSENENPQFQVERYIQRLQSGKLTDVRGRPVKLDQNTIFYCYIVADIVGKLDDWTFTWQRTADGRGRLYRPNGGFLGSVELIGWDALIEDARARNRAFFDRAGISGKSFFSVD